VVDVLDVDRALLDTGAAGRARPQDVGVDDPALRRATDQRPLGLRLRRLILVEQVRRFGVRVVAQAEHEQLGREGFAGIPRWTLRLAPAALGAGGEVEQALPGELLDRGHPELVLVRVGLLEVERLAVAHHRA
jgi:hypothetical protein